MNFKNNNLQDIKLPNAPILVADNSGASQITTHGEIIRLDRGEAIKELNAHPQILCNKKITGNIRLDKMTDNEQKNFKDLRVWVAGVKLATAIYKITKTKPREIFFTRNRACAYGVFSKL